MFNYIVKMLIFITIFIFMFTSNHFVEAKTSDPVTLYESTDKHEMYPSIDLVKDRERKFTIEDVITEEFSKRFVQSELIKQKAGFFETATWIRFEIDNQSKQHEWLLELAFPLVHEVQVYAEEDNGIVELYHGGADFPFNRREIDHRNFIFNLEIEPGESKKFYMVAVGSGDLHPPINIWNKERFIEKTQREFMLLGLFYGVILVMIIYNLFLFFGLRIKSYFYYVLVITFSLLGKLSINGLGFQYLWPHYPKWNVISTPFWVALACIFILIFTRNFLNLDQYIPSYKRITYILIPFNALIIIFLPISRYIALYLMVFGSFITFTTVLIAAIVALKRGARQARFYIIGWLIFLTGVFITILERIVVLPFLVITEYAGQAALTIEVVLLSFALADKINIMRKDKELAEAKVLESQAIAVQSLKKADELKDEFLAITSHELRTPLYGMIGIADSLRDGIAGNVSVEMKNQLSMIITSGQRLTRLVNEILDFSKLKYDSLTLQFKPVNIKNVIDIVVAVSVPLLNNEKVRLVNEVDPYLPYVKADENRLQQILHNLVDNAIKYTDEGDIVITAFVENDQLKINVTDTGHGISEDQIKMIFQPFQQGNISLSREVGGIGIGLNVTKNLVDLHEGKLEVVSKVGDGSTFSVTLPIYDEVIPIREVAATSIIPITDEPKLYHFPQTKGETEAKILVADDEIVNLQVLTNQLSLNGYDVLTVSKGEDVFPIMQSHDIDLLILDIMMPGMSGYEVCQRLRKNYTLMELPILMLTAKNQPHDKLIAFEAGANDYLVKPCNKQELLSRVKTLVRVKTLHEKLVQMNLHLEEKVLERTQELMVANENLQSMAQSRRKLLANIAHELGTPVTLIHSYVQSLQKGLIAIDDHHYRNLVTSKINVLNRLIDDLFDLSKLESGKVSLNLKKFRLNEWLEQTFDKCQFTVFHANRMFNQIPLSSAFNHFTCYYDQERMDQLFSNLISNAIKHTPETTGLISLNALLLGTDRIIIQVSDNGLGINEDELPFIFKRFYKTDSSTSEQVGTGLGLAIVNEIVQSHRGEIKVSSKENEGTTFEIILPIKHERD